VKHRNDTKYQKMSTDFRVAFCQATQSLCPDVQRVIWSTVLPREVRRERVAAAFAAMRAKIIEFESAEDDEDARMHLDLLLGLPVYPPDGVDEDELRAQRRMEAFSGKASALASWKWYRRYFLCNK
jgi:hypothetical protein